jgi:hypothetical protein
VNELKEFWEMSRYSSVFAVLQERPGYHDDGRSSPVGYKGPLWRLILSGSEKGSPFTVHCTFSSTLTGP